MYSDFLTAIKEVPTPLLLYCELEFCVDFHCRVCPETKSIRTNGPQGLKKVGHFRKYLALVNFPYTTNDLEAVRLSWKDKGTVRQFKIFLKIEDDACKF